MKTDVADKKSDNILTCSYILYVFSADNSSAGYQVKITFIPLIHYWKTLLFFYVLHHIVLKSKKPVIFDRLFHINIL
tara:strand:+ start:6286 stop:6516 length:231 start_codon:yes stop_codon:yes gene_type:complete